MPRRAGVSLPSEEVMRGPFPPDSMAQKFGLDTLQATRYQVSWDSMMAVSRPARDSLHEAMGGTRRAAVRGISAKGNAGPR